MRSLVISVPHALTRQEATARLHGLIGRLKDEHGGSVSDLREDWHDERLEFAFSTFGVAISGNLHVEATSVRVDVKLPLAAMFFKARIESTIREQLTALLA